MLVLVTMCRHCYLKMVSAEFVGVVLLIFALADMRFTPVLVFLSIIYFAIAEGTRRKCPKECDGE